MSRKFYIEVKVKIVATIEEGIDISNFIDEMDYNFSSDAELGDIEDTEITEFNILDSK